MKTAGLIGLAAVIATLGVCGVVGVSAMSDFVDSDNSNVIYGPGEEESIGDGQPGFGPGTYLVGDDIASGKYQTAGARPNDLCYWHTAKDTTDNAILEQGTATAPREPGLVTLVKGQYFQTSGCQNWVKK